MTFVERLRELHEKATAGDAIDSGIPVSEWTQDHNELKRFLVDALPDLIAVLEAAERVLEPVPQAERERYPVISFDYAAMMIEARREAERRLREVLDRINGRTRQKETKP